MPAAPVPPEPLVRVAREFADARDRVVFIGGLAAPLLQLEPPMPRTRPTDDVIALVASRLRLPEEIEKAHPTIRHFVSEQVEALLADPDADEIIASHLNDAVPLAEVLEITRGRLEQIAKL